MAKGASTESQLGSLHNKLTALFTKILQRYEDDLDQMVDLDIEEALLESLAPGRIPSPAMLSAVAKFLKDNDISLETEELNELSAMEERLEARKRARPNLASVTNLPLINQNG